MTLAALPKISRKRVALFCSLAFGVALPLAIVFCFAAHQRWLDRPAEFIAVSADPDNPKRVLVLYRSPDGRELTRSHSHKRRIQDERGIEMCLRDFRSGALPFGPVSAALAASGDSSRACAPSAKR